jgi:hypothetical protein
MTNKPAIVKSVLAGLAITQVIATIHVFQSNWRLHQTLTAIDAAGWLAVPTGKVMATLTQLKPAFCGGLFFTLTVGCGLTLLSTGLFWLQVRVFNGNKYISGAIFVLWAALLIRLNIDGPVLLENLYFLFIPLATAFGAIRWQAKQEDQEERKSTIFRIMPVLPVILLALMWWSQAGDGMFLRIRDNLLLSNPVGRFINDFYYKYTLYPAEAFKPTHQKTLKSYRPEVDGERGPGSQKRLENTLARYDYLRIDGQLRPDLRSTWENNVLVFKNIQENRISMPFKDFFAQPKDALIKLSQRGDRLAFFRKFTFYSLLLGFPVVLYILFFTLWELLIGLWLSPSSARLITAGICFAAGVGALVPVWQAQRVVVDEKHLTKALESQNWKVRSKAIRLIHDEGKDIASQEFTGYEDILHSQSIVEQYWLARALGTSRARRAHNDLLGLLDNTCPNVVCQAYYALGQRGDKRAIDPIIAKMKTSDHWYTQWYGYRALKALGWRQTRSR